MTTNDSKCNVCGKPVEPNWKLCPFCGAELHQTSVDGNSPSISVPDSVVTGGIHQSQHTEIREAQGANVGGSIIINVGSEAKSDKPQSNPEYEYERYIMAQLRSSPSLETSKSQTEELRKTLGLTLKQARDIESQCLSEFGKGPPGTDGVGPSQSRIPPHPPTIKASRRKGLPLWATVLCGIAIVAIAVVLSRIVGQSSQTPSGTSGAVGATLSTTSSTTHSADTPATTMSSPYVKSALVVNAIPPGSGTISPSGGQYDQGSQIILKATPASGYKFSFWSGDASGTDPTTIVSLNSDMNVVANFVSIRLQPGTIVVNRTVNIWDWQMTLISIDVTDNQTLRVNLKWRLNGSNAGYITSANPGGTYLKDQQGEKYFMIRGSGGVLEQWPTVWLNAGDVFEGSVSVPVPPDGSGIFSFNYGGGGSSFFWSFPTIENIRLMP